MCYLFFRAAHHEINTMKRMHILIPNIAWARDAVLNGFALPPVIAITPHPAHAIGQDPMGDKAP